MVRRIHLLLCPQELENSLVISLAGSFEGTFLVCSPISSSIAIELVQFGPLLEVSVCLAAPGAKGIEGEVVETSFQKAQFAIRAQRVLL
jgi:hypothetical protein